jgi:hypothetical protein
MQSRATSWLRCSLPLAALLLILCTTENSQARKIHATVDYRVAGPLALVGADGRPDKLDVGAQLLFDWRLSTGSSSSKAAGSVAGHCHVVSVSRDAADAGKAICTLHFDFADGSAMTAHATAPYRAGGALSARLVLAGGIGRWEGAHGQDVAFNWAPSRGGGGGGSGRIELFCLKGVC